MNDDILGKIVQALARQNENHMRISEVLVNMASIMPPNGRAEVLNSIQQLLNGNDESNKAMRRLLEAIGEVGSSGS